MPYTAIQTLGWLATHSKWERVYNVNRSFRACHEQHGGSGGSSCRLFARRGIHKKGGRKIVVFKSLTARMSKVVKASRANDMTKGHWGCGMSDCRACCVLLAMFDEDMDKHGRREAK